MSVCKNLKLLIVTCLMTSLVSCENEHKTSTRKEVNPVCSEVDCLSTVNWKINLQGRAFPDKTRVDINGTTMVNECVSKQKYSIDRYAEPQNLYLENFYVPKAGELKIDVIDLGPNCDSESNFISENNVNFEVTKGIGPSEVIINL